MRTDLKVFGTLILITALINFIGCTRGDKTPTSDLLKLHLAGLNLISQHKFEDAEKVLQKLVDQAPMEFVPRYNLAVSQLNQAENGVDRALANLKIARRIKPDQAKVAYNMGIIQRFLGKEILALEEFQNALRLKSRDPDCHYQVAIGLIRNDRQEESLPHFEMAAEIDPTIRGAWNNLQLAWRRAGRTEDADRALATFRDLETTGLGRSHSNKYTEQGKIAEAIRDWSRASSSRHIFDTNEIPDLIQITAPHEGGAPPFALVDADLDCVPDLWIAGLNPVSYDLSQSPIQISEIPVLKNAVCFAVGDVDEDGIADLAISYRNKVDILRGEEGRTPSFSEAISALPVTATDLLLADIDMEGDLDLLLADSNGPVKLALNEGRSFRSIEESPSLGATKKIERIIAVRDLDNDRDPDLLLAGDTLSWISGAPQWKYQEDPEQRPLLGIEAVNIDSGLLVDLDENLGQELVLLQNGKLRVFANTGSFTTAPGQALFQDEVVLNQEITSKTFRTVTSADLDLDGSQELLLGTPSKTYILHRSQRSLALSDRILPGAQNIVAGDVDGDGDPDLIFEKPDGSLWLLRNNLEIEKHQLHALRAHLGGRRDGDDRRTNLLGFGARLELRNPGLTVLAFQEGSRGNHARGLLPVVVGTSTFSAINSLIIDWPDGVLQAEIKVPTDQCQEIEEVQRKSSSCPVLFTFDGKNWNFITDFMGGGGLGAWIGPDEYAPPEPTEVVRIAPEALQQVGQRLQLSVMEPMQEICYADQLQLLAVDHPSTSSCYPEEFFPVRATPPSGDPVLIRDDQVVFPTALRDANGDLDVERVLKVDRIYAGPRSLIPDLVGYCEDQAWEFSFDKVPAGQRIALLLDGWVEYPYSRINFAAWQGSKRLSAPTFRWRKNPDDPWRLLGKEIGYPAGMPKKMVLDITDLIGQGAREFRIESNLELYWDQVFLAAIEETQKSRVHTIPLHSALLRDGGYPREYSDDGKLPATYHYDERDPTLDYRAMEQGFVTRHGRVDELITKIDDRFVIIGGGDELLLEYDASMLPVLPQGWTRTWLLDTFGWCKDLDPLTGGKEAVGPLPFRGMSQYPPRPEDPAPDRAEYQTHWNTRQD